MEQHVSAVNLSNSMKAYWAIGGIVAAILISVFAAGEYYTRAVARIDALERRFNTRDEFINIKKKQQKKGEYVGCDLGHVMTSIKIADDDVTIYCSPLYKVKTN